MIVWHGGGVVCDDGFTELVDPFVFDYDGIKPIFIVAADYFGGVCDGFGAEEFNEPVLHKVGVYEEPIASLIAEKTQPGFLEERFQIIPSALTGCPNCCVRVDGVSCCACNKPLVDACENAVDDGSQVCCCRAEIDVLDECEVLEESFIGCEFEHDGGVVYVDGSRADGEVEAASPVVVDSGGVAA